MEDEKSADTVLNQMISVEDESRMGSLINLFKGELYLEKNDYEKVEKADITLSKAFAECEVLGETARGKMVTDKLSEVDDYWKNRNIVVDKCMSSKGFKLK